MLACNSKQPKWLELADGEKYLKSILSNQVAFVSLISGVALLSVVMLVAMVFGDAEKVLMPMTMIVASMSTLFASFMCSKLHLTNRRLIMEIKRKYAGEINLGEIKAIQVTKRMVGGKVLIVPGKQGVSGIEVTVVKPQQLAAEIQRLSAGMPDDAEAN